MNDEAAKLAPDFARVENGAAAEAMGDRGGFNPDHLPRIGQRGGCWRKLVVFQRGPGLRWDDRTG